MLDCPEQIQTSPTRILWIVIVWEALMTISYGPPAFRGGSVSIHLPSAEVLVTYVFLLNDILTASPAAAQPHTGTVISRWSTIPSLTRAGNLNWADKVWKPVMANRRTHDFFINRFIIYADDVFVTKIPQLTLKIPIFLNQVVSDYKKCHYEK
jgi:hypothetical protein